MQKNNLEISNSDNSDNIIDVSKRKINKQVDKFVKHKATKKAFDKYINNIGNDKTKLKTFNSQLGNLSKNINTLPKLFKSFTSQKR
jgi:hypothetical protein